jgi:outer membrane lipoprotein SlyB
VSARIATAPMAAALAATLVLAGCASHQASTATGPVATRMPARAPTTVCLGCGTISAREPWELPRWKFHVQMDDGTETIIFQERADWLVVGSRVRLAGGQMQRP